MSASSESKSPKRTEDKGGGNVSIHTIPMDEHRRWLIKIVMLMRVDMRELFGMEVANRWGFWVDRYLSKQVRDFADWIQYPKGDHVLEGRKDGARTIVISDDGYFLFTGDGSGTIKVWNMLDNHVIREWEAHDRRVRSLAFQSGLLVSGSDDNSVKIWDTLRDYQLVHILEGHTKSVMSVDISDKADQVVSGSEDKVIRTWSVKTGECIAVLIAHSHYVTSVHFIGDLILSGSYDESLEVLNPSDGSEIHSVNEGINGYINDVSIDCDASLIACAFDGAFSLFSWPELKFVRSVDSNPRCCAFHPIHPSILAVNNEHHSIHIFDVSNFDVIRTLEGHSGLIRDLHFTPDGCRLISVSDDKSVRIWDVSDV